MSPKSVLAQKSPPSSSLASGKTTPTFTLSSPPPYTKGRFSVSQVTTPSPIVEEQNAGMKDMNMEEKNADQVRTPKSAHVNGDEKTFVMTTPNKLTRRSQHALKKTPMKRRSGAVAVLDAKRRSGASSANLLGLFRQLIFNMNLNTVKSSGKIEVDLFLVHYTHNSNDCRVF